MPATYDDANLVVQLLRWGADIGLQDALNQVLADDFDAESASSGDPSVRTILFFGETVGTFVKQGVLDPGLVDDLFWVDGLWGCVAPVAIHERQKFKEPRLYENFEALTRR